MNILLKTPTGARMLNCEHIVCVKAFENCATVYFYTPFDSALVFDNFQSLNTFTEIERFLVSCPEFYKCHRSYIINIEYFKEFDSKNLQLILQNCMKIKLSRLRKQEFKKFLLSKINNSDFWTTNS